MKYFDAHTHVHFAAYDADRSETLTRSLEAEVSMNLVGTQVATSEAAVALAEAHPGIYATVGLHPVHTTPSYHDVSELGTEETQHATRGEVFDASRYERMAQSKKVIAIGECGLDYYRIDEMTRDTQITAFVQQIELAQKLRKPLMLHIRNGKGGERNAYEDALDILSDYPDVVGNVHFFAGDWVIARAYLERGYTLSFTGVVTFARDYDEVIRNTPLDMLHAETDAPYVTPVPFRGKRNEPLYVQRVVEAIASIRAQDPELVRVQLLDNARRVFSIDV